MIVYGMLWDVIWDFDKKGWVLFWEGLSRPFLRAFSQNALISPLAYIPSGGVSRRDQDASDGA